MREAGFEMYWSVSWSAASPDCGRCRRIDGQCLYQRVDLLMDRFESVEDHHEAIEVRRCPGTWVAQVWRLSLPGDLYERVDRLGPRAHLRHDHVGRLARVVEVGVERVGAVALAPRVPRRLLDVRRRIEPLVIGQRRIAQSSEQVAEQRADVVWRRADDRLDVVVDLQAQRLPSLAVAARPCAPVVARDRSPGPSRRTRTSR